MAWPPEARAISGEAAVVDVNRGHAESVPRHRLEIAHHIGLTGIAGDVHALPLRIRQLRPQRRRQTETERGDVAPAQEATRQLRLVHGADLVAGVPGVTGHEG